jgi:ribosomal protein S18 acetylase RimI-like enzyme
MISIKLIDEEEELAGILRLNNLNLGRNLSDDEAADQGFVTAEYTLEFLSYMNKISPSVIAKVGNEVVGYALVATKNVKGHALLEDLIFQVNQLKYDNHFLRDVDYAVVGQLCIAKDYRSKGLVQQLYGFFRTSLQGKYKYGITDVDRNNKRSLKAHLKTGFQVIHSVGYGGSEWDVILWDWTTPSHSTLPLEV